MKLALQLKVTGTARMENTSTSNSVMMLAEALLKALSKNHETAQDGAKKWKKVGVRQVHNLLSIQSRRWQSSDAGQAYLRHCIGHYAFEESLMAESGDSRGGRLYVKSAAGVLHAALQLAKHELAANCSNNAHSI